MLSGVNAYQQQVTQLQQSQVQQPQRNVEELRERDKNSDETKVARTSTEEARKSNAAETSREDRRLTAANNQTSQAGGKDAAQRRGSLLDVKA